MTLFYNDDEINDIKRILKAIKGDRRYRTFMQKMNDLLSEDDLQLTKKERVKGDIKPLAPTLVKAELDKYQTAKSFGVRGLIAMTGFNHIDIKPLKTDTIPYLNKPSFDELEEILVTHPLLPSLDKPSFDAVTTEFIKADIEPINKPKLDVPSVVFEPIKIDTLTRSKRSEMPNLSKIEPIRMETIPKLDKKPLPYSKKGLKMPLIKADELAKIKKPKIEFDKINSVVIPFPHIRKKRKTWKGEKRTYNPSDLSVNHAKGYAMRSLARHYPELTLYDHKKIKERMLRSVSHTLIRADIEHIKTQKLEVTGALKDAYKQFAEYLLKQELNTSPRVDAFYEYIGENKFIDFINETFEPKIIAFVTLHDKLKRFIAENWNEYNVTALDARQDKMDMNLTKSQIDALPNADRSYLET